VDCQFGKDLKHSDEAATSLSELTTLVTALKEIIEKQTNVIENAQADLTEIKTEQQTLKRQNGELQEQICSLQSQISAYSASLPSTRSWASIATNQSGAEPSQPAPNDTVSTDNTFTRYPPTSSTKTDTLYCMIDTSRVADEDTNKTSAGAIRTVVEKEIRTKEGHANWRCQAVTRDVKNKNRIRIACRDEAEHQIVKQVAETKIATGVRVLRDEICPIKVDSVNRFAVLDDKGEIRAGVAEALGRENEVTVAKIAWLSKKDTPKAYGSMVVYVTKGSDASRLLAEGFFHAGGEPGTTSSFEHRPRPEQCYNCQEIGHKAFQCKNGQKCAKCAKDGHHHSNCSETVPKCVLCGGPHESFSKNCRKLYPQHE
jgi:hypothetical protein